MEKLKGFCIVCAVLWIVCIGGCWLAFNVISPEIYSEQYENICWTIAVLSPVCIAAVEIYGDSK